MPSMYTWFCGSLTFIHLCGFPFWFLWIFLSVLLSIFIPVSFKCIWASQLIPISFFLYSFNFLFLCCLPEISNNRDYRSISEFFTRQLRPDVRTISTASCMVSPVDGTVLHFGLANGHQIEQVSFNFNEFFTFFSW